MSETLHILTACSRMPGLARIAPTLRSDLLDLRWHIGYDLTRRHVGGQAVKNSLLSDIAGGWVWFCDDDNLPHPDFLSRLPAMLDDPGRAGLIVGQDRGARGYAPPSAQVGQVDIAQIVVRRDCIGALRIPETYDGDGHFIALLTLRGGVDMVDAPLSYYNAQRWL